MADFDKKGRVWAEIDLDNLIWNLGKVRCKAGDKKIMAVVKADAYGHGFRPVTRALSDAGVDYFGVAATEEALQLRREGIAQPILVMGVVPPAFAKEIAGQNIALTVTSAAVAKAYAEQAGVPLKVHVKVDTGMHRLGVPAKDAAAAAAEIMAIAATPNISVEGVFTHFASADDPAAEAFTKEQVRAFSAVLNQLEKNGLNVPFIHCANSAGVIQYPEERMNMVRAGIILYGHAPDGYMAEACADFRPVMTLKSRICQLQALSKGDSVSYGRSWKAPDDRRIATVSIGYADGLMRAFSDRVTMLAGGKEAKQIGRICMDMCMLDVTEIPRVGMGDIVTVFGADAPVEKLALAAGTITYEILCGIGKRVPRIYYRGGVAVDRVEYI